MTTTFDRAARRRPSTAAAHRRGPARPTVIVAPGPTFDKGASLTGHYADQVGIDVALANLDNARNKRAALRGHALSCKGQPTSDPASPGCWCRNSQPPHSQPSVLPQNDGAAFRHDLHRSPSKRPKHRRRRQGPLACSARSDNLELNGMGGGPRGQGQVHPEGPG
jgi:hypothetical protein